MNLNPELALVPFSELLIEIFEDGNRNFDSVEHIVIWNKQVVPLVSKNVNWDQIQLIEYSWFETTTKLGPESTGELDALVSLGFLQKICENVYEVTQSLRDSALKIFEQTEKSVAEPVYSKAKNIGVDEDNSLPKTVSS